VALRAPAAHVETPSRTELGVSENEVVDLFRLRGWEVSGFAQATSSDEPEAHQDGEDQELLHARDPNGDQRALPRAFEREPRATAGLGVEPGAGPEVGRFRL
jgi:hypothetical protein